MPIESNGGATAPTSQTFLLFEVLTVTTLFALMSICVRPLLEEWDVFYNLQRDGLAFIQANFLGTPLRALHLTQYSLQYLFGLGLPLGVGLATAVLAVARYFLARWALTPLMNAPGRWACSLLAAAPLEWTGAWLGRFGSAQMSAAIFLLIVGFSIRSLHKQSLVRSVATTFATILLLLNYQGLTLCLAMLPLGAFVLTDPLSDKKWQASARVAWPLLLGFAIYLLYFQIVRAVTGSGGYEESLMNQSGGLFTLRGISQHITTVYSTVYGPKDGVLLSFVAVLFASYFASQMISGKPFSWAHLFVPVSLLLLLPLTGMIYTSEIHAGDVDRLLFPLSFGLFLIVVVLLSAKSKGKGAEYMATDGSNWIVVLVACVCIVSGATSALKVKGYWEIEEELIAKVLPELSSKSEGKLLIVDRTGRYGDVYTFLTGHLGYALSVVGYPTSAEICTPKGVDRHHYVALRYPIPTTRRCEEIPPDAGTLVLGIDGPIGSLAIDRSKF